jgi:hypothetical protein
VTTAAEPVVSIKTLEDYRRACRLHDDMEKIVPDGDWHSPAARRRDALIAEIVRFEADYAVVHGILPDETN